MRVLLATINYDHPQLGMKHAFEGIFGVSNVAEFDYLAKQRERRKPNHINDEFFELARQHKPAWIWLQVQDTAVLSAETLERLRRALPDVVITHWTGDARPSVSPYLRSICQQADVTFVSAKGHLPMFRDAGARRAEYLQIGVDWHEDVLGEPAWEPPFRVPAVVFCGSYYGEQFPAGTRDRCAAIKSLQRAGIDVGIVGSGWPKEFPVVGQCAVKQQVHVYRRALLALNVNHFNDIERYYSDRQLIAMASGTPLLCHYVPKLEEEFVSGYHCEWYRDADGDLPEKAKRLLADDTWRAQMGRSGRAEILRTHTWFTRVLEARSVVETVRR